MRRADHGHGLRAGGVAYLYMLSPKLCTITLGISVVLWAVTLAYGDFARRAQKVFQVSEGRAAAERSPASSLLGA